MDNGKNGTVREELSQVIESAQLNLEETIKRGFTNAAVQRSRWRESSNGGTTDSHPIKYIFFNVDDNTTVNISDLHLVGTPNFHVTSLRVDLLAMTMDVGFSLGRVQLNGRYEANNTALARLLPLSNVGSITITADDVRASGYVGLHIKGDSFVTTTYDLTYTTLQDINVKVEYPSHEGEMAIGELTSTNLDKTILKKCWKQLTHLLNKLIESQLGEVIVEISVEELLHGEADYVSELTNHITSTSKIIDQTIDTVLLRVRSFATRRLNVHPSVGTIQTSFTRRASPQRPIQRGTFIAGRAWFSEPSSVKRVGHASCKKEENGDLWLYAMVEFEDLKLGYDEYAIQYPRTISRGKLKISIDRNVGCLKLRLAVDQMRKYTSEIKHFSLLSFSEIDIDVTGLGSLSNLVPDIGTWVLGIFADRIVPKLEEEIVRACTKSLELVSFEDLLLKT